ncbi:MAG: uL15 family ribosomal protein [Patescibacteria group bacterium]
MQLHQLKPKFKKKAVKRVGRGGKKGTYSGRGMKGQKSRAGRKPRLDFAGGDTPLTKRFPKQRGITGRHKDTKVKKGVKLSRFKTKPIILNLKKIEEKFKKGELVSPKSLLKKGLIGKIKGRWPRIKILGQAEFKKELVFRGIEFSKRK